MDWPIGKIILTSNSCKQIFFLYYIWRYRTDTTNNNRKNFHHRLISSASHCRESLFERREDSPRNWRTMTTRLGDDSLTIRLRSHTSPDIERSRRLSLLSNKGLQAPIIHGSREQLDALQHKLMTMKNLGDCFRSYNRLASSKNFLSSNLRWPNRGSTKILK